MSFILILNDEIVEKILIKNLRKKRNKKKIGLKFGRKKPNNDEI
jgi:hypothetical protein